MLFLLRFSETLHSVEVHIRELAGLGITDGTMRTILGLLDAADGNPILYEFNYAF